MESLVIIGLGLIGIGIAIVNGRKPVLQPVKIKNNDSNRKPNQ